MTNQEKILQMVKDGTIEVHEGVKLLEALVEPSKELVHKKAQAKMLRVKIDSESGDKVRVNVPLSLIKAGVDLSKSINIDGESLQSKGLDVELILQAIEEGATGEIVDITSAEGDIIKVFVD